MRGLQFPQHLVLLCILCAASTVLADSTEQDNSSCQQVAYAFKAKNRNDEVPASTISGRSTSDPYGPVGFQLFFDRLLLKSSGRETVYQGLIDTVSLSSYSLEQSFSSGDETQRPVSVVQVF